MNKLTNLKLIFMVMVLMIANTAIAGTETLTGRVYASVTHTLMPLGNGSAAINSETVGIVAMGGDSPMVYKLTCIGLGIQDTEDKFTNNVYCIKVLAKFKASNICLYESALKKTGSVPVT